MPLYETVNAFAAGESADFGGALPAFRLDPGILAARLGADGAPVYARRANGYTLTTHGAGAALSCLCVVYPEKLAIMWKRTDAFVPLLNT